MRVSSALLAVAAAASVSAANNKRDAPGSPDDVTILNYALTLEHLENAFYQGVLAKFDEAAFRAEGYPKWVYERVQLLSTHEKNHVAFLSGALGDAATKPCEYKFPYTTVAGALGLSRVLESVGVSAYLGAAKDIDTDAYLTAAGSILTVEARHQAVVAEVNGGLGFPSPYDTPLGYSQVYTLAAPFITSCPDTNPTLPVKKFNDLTFRAAKLLQGRNIKLFFEADTGNTLLYAHVLNGLNDIVVTIKEDKSFRLPNNIEGVTYIVVSTSQTLDDSNTVAGPAYLDLKNPVLTPSFQKVSVSARA